MTKKRYSILSIFRNINLFVPNFLKWILPSLNLDMSTDAKIGFQSNVENRMANSVDPHETVHYEPAHLDLYSLHRYLFLIC